MIFRQTRIGKDGREFTIYKIRTMDEDGNITRPFLRRSGLDEIPQLWNICKGDMRVFGPRPELPHIHNDNVEKLGEIWASRLRMKPGLISLATVSLNEARQAERYDSQVLTEKAILDNTMIDDMSVGLRIRILLRVPQTVLRGQLT